MKNCYCLLKLLEAMCNVLGISVMYLCGFPFSNTCVHVAHEFVAMTTAN